MHIDSRMAPLFMTQLHQELGNRRLLSASLVAHLESNGHVGVDDIARARAAAEAADKRVDQALLELGLVTESALAELLSQSFGVREAAREELPATAIMPELLKPTYLKSALAIPLDADDASITLAMVDPLDDFTANAIALKTGLALRRLKISRAAFEGHFERLYGMPASPVSIADENGGPLATDGDVDLLRDAASDAPVIRFVQDTIRAAVQLGASDIHLRPSRARPELLFRINGSLVSQPALDTRMFPSVISRLKILANLDISERRLPQDGRLRVNVGGRPVDIRMSTMPHVHGEAAVLRLLSREHAVSSLGELGFSREIEAGLMTLFGVSDGLILVTGPTGSGKTTTLHAALKQLIRPELNVVTIEDPVEYRVDGAAQVQVEEKIGLTFPRVLRSLLRQDPDIILVGEIRDAETAQIAVQAALTGHLVLATLHTNSALAAVPRLVDMGVEPYLLAAVLRGALAQRLVRRLCRHCATVHGEGRVHGGGCADCAGTGYSGRVAVGELARLEPELTGWLCRSLELSEEQMARLRASGYRPLQDDVGDRVRAGEIDSREVQGLLNVNS
jgi:general secretion pathway protein E